MKKLAYNDPLVDREILQGKMKPVASKVKSNKESAIGALKRVVVGKVSDAMSYPKRSMYDAISSVKNRQADALRLNREMGESRKKHGFYPK